MDVRINTGEEGGKEEEEQRRKCLRQRPKTTHMTRLAANDFFLSFHACHPNR